MTKALTKPDPATPAINIQDALLQIVQRTDIDPERLEKFLDLQIKIENRQAELAFNNALAQFQGECPIIEKSKKVKFTSSSGKNTEYDYAPLDEIIHIIKPLLSKHGLAYSFDIKSGEKTSTLLTTITHRDGHSRTTTVEFETMHDDTRMNQSQRRKSAITFTKRAGLENALGIVTTGEDDDARRAIDNPATKEQLDTIVDLLAKTKSDTKGFCEFFKISKIEDFSEYEAKRAILALKEKRAKSCTK